jgi:lipopolysaccharide biosynthesis glycosyltransferase
MRGHDGERIPAMRMKVFCATDENYVQMTHVMLASLLANSRASLSAIHVFGWRLSAQSVLAFEDLDRELIRVHDYQDLPAALEPIRFRIVDMVPTWMRLVAPDLIAADDENLLYIDCDCIVDRDLADLTTIDLGTAPFGAVADFAKAKHSGWLERLGLPLDTPYFNAGVMLFAHRRYQEGGWSRRALDLTLSIPDRLKLHDQDVFNTLVEGRWVELPWSYNAHASSAKTKHGDGGELFEGAHIIHYVGKRKPTDADCRHAAKDIFLRYRATTVWRDVPLRKAWCREVFNHLRMGTGKVKRFLAGRGLKVR